MYRNRCALLATVAVVCAAVPAQAQLKSFDLAAQPVDSAVKLFSKQADVQVLAARTTTNGKVANAVQGTVTVQEGLKRLLAGTGLEARATAPQTYTIVRTAAGSASVSGVNYAPASQGSSTQANPEVEAAPASLATPKADEPAVDIVVTGSRLSSRGYQAPSPVNVVDSQEFKLSGAQTVETTLIQSPQFIGSGYDSSGNGLNKGVAALNVRGLGEKRSLTLVNGRRYTVAGPDGLTDLNTIPAALISRVDIVTGGSSAVYGSDALAGVVNFILKDDFSGVLVDAERRWDQHTDTPTYSADLTIGGNFAENRGNAVISVNYLNRDGITRGQYPWAQYGLADGCVTPVSYSAHAPGVPVTVGATQTCEDAGGRRGFITNNSGSTLAGRIAGIPIYGSSSSNAGLNAALLAAGLQNAGSFGITFDQGSTSPRAALDPSDRYNNSPPNYMQTPLRRWMVNSLVNYKLTDDMTAYIEGHYSNTLSNVQLAPNGIGGNFLINTNNPYVSSQFQAVLRQLDLSETSTTTLQQGSVTYTTTRGDGLAILNINKRLPESFPRAEREERNTFRTVIGLRGKAFGDLNYDVYYSYARTQETDQSTGNLSTSRVQAALLSQGGASPVLNVFGPDSVTVAAANAVSVTATSSLTNKQQVASANLTGSLFSLPAGPVDFSAGVEWRRTSLDSVPDGLLLLSDIVGGVPATSAVHGSTDVKEGYSEVRVPILTDVPFARRLAVTGAGRYSHYNTVGVGGVWTNSAGVQWKPINDILFRGQYQRAIRAPNVSELYGAMTTISTAIPDPCSNRGAAAQQTAAVRALCVATGVPAALVFTGAVQPNAYVQSINGGNPNVGPEKSDTFTGGIVLTPHQVPNLALSVDFYKVTIDGAIAPQALNAQNLLNLCYFVAANASSPYCQAVHRDPLDGELSGLNGHYIDQLNSNTGGIKVSGVDLDLQYAFRVGLAPLGGSSRVSMSVEASYTGSYVFTPVQALPDVKNHCAGYFGQVCGLPAPKLKGVARITWQTGPLTLSARSRYTGVVRRDRPTAVSINRIPAYDYVDLSFAVTLPAGFEVTGGVNNVAGTAPPILGSGAPTWGVNTAPGVYEILGRSFYMGLKKQF